ncbi:hypothetical protein [Burkholderia cepacia]|uniref:hypothetical protein n=1 Tax=Burkholderia cepacia TaxID=292 RepID=UPI00158E9014|nr:hypothetical protein [Burkholderia cepacia]
MSDKNKIWYWLKIAPILFLIGVAVCTSMLAAANALPPEIRARVLLAFAIYLAVGFAALNLLRVKLYPIDEPEPHQFVAGVLWMARRSLFMLSWPITAARVVAQRLLRLLG